METEDAPRAEVPIEFKGDAVVWAAWLYYEDNLNQAAVADRLGVSRASVVKLLHLARERGVVTIQVAPGHLASVRGSQALRQRYGLEAALVVPDDGGASPVHERIGRAAGQYLASIVAEHDCIGVCWGETMLSLALSVPQCVVPNVTVVQAVGSAIGPYDSSTERCSLSLAARLGARCVNLHAPGVVSKPSLKAELMAEPSIRRQFAVIQGCSHILFGLTGLGPDSMVFTSGYLTPPDAQPYLDAGAVGMLAGRFYDAEGEPVAGPLDDRMIGITLGDMRAIPRRICVAGGEAKVPALRAMLRGRFATVLVTDEGTAARLLD